MISAATVSTISLTYVSGGSWSVFNSTNLATGGNLQANWTDITSQIGAYYKPLLNSAANEIGILEGASGANYIGISGTTGIATGSTVYSAIFNLSSSLSSSAGPTFDHIHLTNGQIGFPAVQVPSADVNTLDDYEEGTWTPGISFGAGTTGITYNATYTTGYYTKIGNVVAISAFLNLTSKGTSTGTALITGLPFTVSDNIAAYAAVALRFNKISFANQFNGYAIVNTTTIGLEEITEAGAMTNITNTDFADDSQIILSVTYRTA
jgi:hypothetical protein